MRGLHLGPKQIFQHNLSSYWMNFYRKLLVAIDWFVARKQLQISKTTFYFICHLYRINNSTGIFGRVIYKNGSCIFSSWHSMKISFALFFSHIFMNLQGGRKRLQYNTRVSPLTALLVCFSYFHSSELLMSGWFHVLITN